MVNDTKIEFPDVIYINLSGRCQLRCDFCWGPKHDIDMMLSVKDWQKILRLFSEGGINTIVFTGGEPLLHKESIDLIKYVKETLKIRVSLSTNGLLHKRLEKIALLIDDVGIPLDGSGTEINSLMRPPGKEHFMMALKAMRRVKNINPSVYLTVRTIVSKVTKDDVINIGKILLDEKIQLDRWKLYRFTPTGLYGKLSVKRHGIGDDEFVKVVEKIVDMYPELNIEFLDHSDRWGKYIFVMPDGFASTVTMSGMDYVCLGNALESVDGVMQKFRKVMLQKYNNFNRFTKQ